jgi:hypothetical protein
VGDDVTWWKDRDKWMPGYGDDPVPQHDGEDEERIADEDIGDTADDSSDEFDDSEPPARGPDQ